MKTPTFDQVVERHYPALYAVAVRLMGNPRRAFVVTQRALRHASENPAIGRGLLVQALLLEIAAVAA